MSAQEGTPAALFNDWPIKPLQAAYIHNLRPNPRLPKIGLLVNVFKGIPPGSKSAISPSPVQVMTSVAAPPFEDDDQAEYEKAYGAASSKHITMIRRIRQPIVALKEPLINLFQRRRLRGQKHSVIPCSAADSRQKGFLCR